MSAALAIALAGRGGENGSTQEPLIDLDKPFSARFVERTDFNVEGERWRGTIRGAFDWDARKGWATERNGGLVTGVVLRVRTRGADDGFTSTRDYFDFGVEVNVAPPRGR